jgi:hypothetical protein
LPDKIAQNDGEADPNPAKLNANAKMSDRRTAFQSATRSFEAVLQGKFHRASRRKM